MIADETRFVFSVDGNLQNLKPSRDYTHLTYRQRWVAKMAESFYLLTNLTEGKHSHPFSLDRTFGKNISKHVSDTEDSIGD